MNTVCLIEGLTILDRFGFPEEIYTGTRYWTIEIIVQRQVPPQTQSLLRDMGWTVVNSKTFRL